MAEFTERAVCDMEQQVGMDAHTIRQWATNSTQGDRHCIVGFALERSEGFMECLGMLRKVAHAYCQYWCLGDDDHCEDCIEISKLLAEYKDV